MNGCLLLEYRCRAKGCLLLRVWQTPEGPAWQAPGRALSNRGALARDLEQTALGVGETGRLDDCPPLLWLPLICRHVNESAWLFDIRADLADATPGRPVRALWPRDIPGH